MKTLHRYKKVFKNTCLSIICALFFVVSSASPAKADTIQAHGTVSTSYGSYTWSAQQAASTIPITVSLPYIGISFAYNSGTSFSIDYSLKNQYSGVVTITVTGNNTWSVDNVNIITSGCTLDSLPSDHASYKTSHSFTLRLKQSQNFSFVIYGAGSTVFLGSTSVSVSHNMSVDNKIDQIDSTLDLYLPGMSNALSGLGYDSNTSTSLTADTLAYDISIIKNYIDGIEGYLSANNSYIDQIEGYLNQLININKISTFELWQHNVLFWANSYESVNFDSSMPYINYLSSYHDSDYDVAHRLCVGSNSTQSLYFYSSSSINISNIYLYYRGSDPEVSITRTYSVLPPMNMYMYRLDFTNNTNSLSYFELEFDKSFILYPIFWGDVNTTPDDVHYLFGEELNNTYTRLLQQIATGIGNISQQQVIENNTNINNYNNYQTQINNVENNYYQEYNTYNTDIQNNNIFDFSGLSSDGVAVYNNLFTSVFQIDLVKWPILIILLGLIIVIVLG